MADVVIVGVDGSEAGTRAAEFALQRTRESGARLVIAHVVPWSPYAIQTAMDNERRHVTKQQEIAAAHQSILDPLIERLGAEDGELEGVVRHGHPAETLCDIAKEYGARHIVVGRTGQSRVRSLLFGSTAGNLIQISTIPVTVVP